MSWTDDRVATLTKMWKDGRSAAEIAKELGGVTRNAVIGKAHRLGLSGRASPIKKKKETAKKTATKTAAKKTTKTTKKKAAAKAEEKPEASAKQQKMVTDAIKAAAAEEPSKAKEGGITLLELTERVCKWPIGDPQESDFHFCGMPSMNSLPYCEEHAAMAYQTPRKAGAAAKTKGSLKIVGDEKKAKDGKDTKAEDEIDEEDLEVDIDDLADIDNKEVDDDDTDGDDADIKNAS